MILRTMVVFGPGSKRRVLVDHAFIVAGGEIAKAAGNWLGEQVDASHRSRIMFIQRKRDLDHPSCIGWLWHG